MVVLPAKKQTFCHSDAVADLIIAADVTGKILYANAMFEAALHFSNGKSVVAATAMI